MIGERIFHQVGGLVGDVKAARRGPEPYVRRKVRGRFIGMFARFIRRIV